MKEIGNSIAQLAAIIMILITLAVSTAAVSNWFSPDEQAGAAEVSLQAEAPRASSVR